MIRFLLMKPWARLLLAVAAFAGPARGAPVLLLDVCAEEGEAGDLLDETAALLPSEHRALLSSNLGLATAADVIGESERAGIESLIERATGHFQDFQPDEAEALLAEASARLDSQGSDESGYLVLRANWLYSQLAVYRGAFDEGFGFVKSIVWLAPWWELPQAYIPPEWVGAIEEERSRVVAQGARVGASRLPADGRVAIDGIDVGSEREIPVAPGHHVVRVTRPGYADSHRIDLLPGQRWQAEVPTSLHWNESAREVLRRGTEPDPPADVASLLSELAAATGAELVVVASAARDGESGALVAGVFEPGCDCWR